MRQRQNEAAPNRARRHRARPTAPIRAARLRMALVERSSIRTFFETFCRAGPAYRGLAAQCATPTPRRLEKNGGRASRAIPLRRSTVFALNRSTGAPPPQCSESVDCKNAVGDNPYNATANTSRTPLRSLVALTGTTPMRQPTRQRVAALLQLPPRKARGSRSFAKLAAQ